ncbi:MAG TPA: hypothetical protein DCZ01_08710 [Elusimicrobia bacterium]|nr:MAG: hypothetical protein A2X37_08735 [Elusimicrobia bacterium GWA2_66_18]OGR76469.1 MAG: hypothetical protein A2X40_01325 [Elusimicrobia bacterium GWC2_65_9]HAZ08583.1 hypothetical protein [Elusimicrobiota bacterium]
MTLQTLEKKVSKIHVGSASNPIYSFLVERFPPREMKSASEHRAYRELVGTLMRELAHGADKRSAEGIRQYLRVLSPFLARFEQTHWPRSQTSGREVLAFLIQQNGLTQADLEKEIGAQPYVSDILRGKKTLTSGQIGKLSSRFGVSPAVFFVLRRHAAMVGSK